MLFPFALSLLLAPLAMGQGTTIFKYCTTEGLTGNCNTDDASSLNHCGT